MIAIVWIYLNSIFYVGLGLFTFLKPQAVAKTVGFQLTTPGALAELNACYGGLMFMLGVIMYLALAKQNVTNALAFIALIYLGFGTGRIIGILSSAAHDSTTLSFLAVEISSFVISAVLYFRVK